MDHLHTHRPAHSNAGPDHLPGHFFRVFGHRSSFEAAVPSLTLFLLITAFVVADAADGPSAHAQAGPFQCRPRSFARPFFSCIRSPFFVRGRSAVVDTLSADYRFRGCRRGRWTICTRTGRPIPMPAPIICPAIFFVYSVTVLRSR